MTHDAPRSTSGRLALPDNELSWRFSRSSGAGGQHVNTSDTRVELIWSLDDSTALSPAQKELAASRLAGRLVDGTITIVSSQYRSQHRNREAARVRLEELLAKAVVPPRPRRATKPTRAPRRSADSTPRSGVARSSRVAATRPGNSPQVTIVVICARTSRPERTDMKVRSSLASLKNQPGSQIVRRHGRTFVINKNNPRLKARQG